ncbi:hypothetical protein HYV81_00230 [Candidatus Woesearchaeota archaeon]|nr:hypothetical protein [Candidatus Woesearchaeota archaeon]
MTKIQIKEVIEDKTSDFNIKRYKLSGLTLDEPIKTFDISLTTNGLFNGIKIKNKVLEKRKSIRHFETIKKVIEEDDDKIINQFFGKAQWAAGYPSLINVTFDFNPYNFVNKMESIASFFDYYYTYSKDLLFVPNIRYKKSNNIIIDLANYKKFVDEVYNLLNKKNSKPIFVPISLRFPIKYYEDLIKHYKKKDYLYFWFDFEGKPINEAIAGRIRSINSLIREQGLFKQSITYFTNIKREILSNIKDLDSPASDILATVIGANITGVNREPLRFFESGVEVPDPNEIWKHKARNFDKDSYYYVKKKGPVEKKNENFTNNSIVLNEELSNQSEYFSKKLEIRNYLLKKRMLNEYQNGNFLRRITNSGRQAGLSSFF